MEVYWASVEFDIKNPPAYENCVGGFVYMFLKAGDVLDAIPIIRETRQLPLLNQRFRRGL